MPTVIIGDVDGADFSGAEDNQIQQDNATSNFGDSSFLEANKYEVGGHHNSVLKFSGIDSLPSPLTVSSATLYLRVTSGSATTDTITIKVLNRLWVEMECTWNIYSTGNNWSTAGGLHETDDRSSTISASAAINNTQEYKSFTAAQLATDVKDMADGGHGNYGWHLERTDDENDEHYKVFASSDHGTTTIRPYISVTYEEGGGDAEVTPPALVGAGSIPTPTVGIAATPSTLVGAGTIPTPVVGAGVLPSALSGAGTIPAPTVAGAANVTPSALMGVGDLFGTPQVSVSHTPIPLIGAGTIPTPTIEAEATPTGLIGAGTILTPIVQGASTLDGEATPEIVGGAGTVLTPTVSGAAVVSPAAVVGAGTIPAATLGAGATASPSAVTGAGTMPSPIVSGGSSVDVRPAPLSGIGTAPAPSIDITSRVFTQVVMGAGSIPAPSVAGVPVVSEVIIGVTLAAPGIGITLATPGIDIEVT